MPKLTAAAKKSLRNHGYYKCSKPSKPYRVVIDSMTGLSGYNKLYVKGFLNGLNTGDCYRWEDGTVTSRQCHWVKAVATTDKSFGVVATLYYTTNPNPIGEVVDDTYVEADTLTVHDLDVMSDGMYGSEKQFVCEDEDGHDGEDCTCHAAPKWDFEEDRWMK